MRRVLSPPGLAAAVWVSYLAFMGLLAVMAATLAWHPHFLPMTAASALVIGSGLALITGASWRIVRGPDRRRALACLLVGAAPLWFVAGFVFHGLGVVAGQRKPLNAATRMLLPLAQSAMDLEARFVYPRRTAGEKVVMISAPMPKADARAQVDAMDRHIRALEARLDRKIRGRIHWIRGPLFGVGRFALIGLCLGTRPGEDSPDAEGLCSNDRHEVAHCVLNGQCGAGFAPPAVLTEGWAEANQGTDRLLQALRVRALLEGGGRLTLRELTGPDWYDRHEWDAYLHGAPLVSFLLDRYGPDRFVRLYTECSPSTFESDCRRILGLDLDGLDAAFVAEIVQLTGPSLALVRRRLEGFRLDPRVDAAAWKAFLADYFDASERLLAPYRHSRLSSAWTSTTTDAHGQVKTDSSEMLVQRSGEMASMRRRSSHQEMAELAHPRRSFRAFRQFGTPVPPWDVQVDSTKTPDQARHVVLHEIDRWDNAGQDAALLVGLADLLTGWGPDLFAVAAFERFTEGGRPRVRVRFEDRPPAGLPAHWRKVTGRSITVVLAADDLYAAQSQRVEGIDDDDETYDSEFFYDRHEGVPVLRSERGTTTAPSGKHSTSELKVVERRFGPIPETEFDPDRFLDGPCVTDTGGVPSPGEPSRLPRPHWLLASIGAVGLVAGALLSLGGRRPRASGPTTTPPADASGVLMASIVLGSMLAGPAPARAERMDYLDNGTIRIGVDLDIGGTITHLSRSKDGANLINSHDLGRQVQQSYYSGPQPFGKAHPGWKDWPWNPIGSGDVYKHPSRVIEHSNDGQTLYVKTIPMQWALDNVPGECTFETWITTEESSAVVRCRLKNNRPDKTQYAAHDQELPAVYTIGKLYKLFTYDGERPFENQPLRQVHNAGPPWTNWKATENWAALVDDRGIGVGVIHPGVYSFIGGFHDRPNTGGPKDNPTGYIAPVRKEVLDHNIVYEYRYILAVGTLEEIRAAASANRVRDTRPDDRFDRDRRHWIYHNARDAGFPIAGGLRIRTTGDDPQWIGPERWWRADDLPKLFIRAAFRTRGDRARVFWSVPGQGFSDGRRVELTIRPDGMLHTYAVDLASAPGYRGTITGLRIDPPDANGPEDEVRLESISWRPE